MDGSNSPRSFGVARYAKLPLILLSSAAAAATGSDVLQISPVFQQRSSTAQLHEP